MSEMTMRDQFAIEAMKSILARPGTQMSFIDAHPDSFAKSCYDLADIFLQARQEKPK